MRRHRSTPLSDNVAYLEIQRDGGQEIPSEAYRAAAEIIAFVYRMKG